MLQRLERLREGPSDLELQALEIAALLRRLELPDPLGGRGADHHGYRRGRRRRGLAIRRRGSGAEFVRLCHGSGRQAGQDRQQRDA